MAALVSQPVSGKLFDHLYSCSGSGGPQPCHGWPTVWFALLVHRVVGSTVWSAMPSMIGFVVFTLLA